MTIQALTIDEIGEAGGAFSLSDSIQIGSGAGAVYGVLMTNTMTGAAYGGAVGAALGFAFGAGFAVGGLMYNHLF